MVRSAPFLSEAPAEVILMNICMCEPGELPGEVVTVISNPEGLKEIINLPAGSAKAVLETLLPIIQVYLYLETSSSWDLLGPDIMKNSANLRQKIREGEKRTRRCCW